MIPIQNQWIALDNLHPARPLRDMRIDGVQVPAGRRCAETQGWGLLIPGERLVQSRYPLLVSGRVIPPSPSRALIHRRLLSGINPRAIQTVIYQAGWVIPGQRLD